MGTRQRVLPALDERNGFFWTSGADGRLRMLTCAACGYRVHPPGPRCPSCLDCEVAPAVLSGRGRLHSFTVNHHPWDPSQPDAYVIGVVELEEQAGLRLTANIVDCRFDDLRIGMPVEVLFEAHDDVFLPLFRPTGGV